MKPKKICHFADTHIFFQKKFEAHEYVFNEFYKELEKEQPDLIVCVGDLIDSKTKLSPEQFDLARNFLLNLSNFCPVVIILGNHDLNLANKERLDSISPIINAISNETTHPIHFFKHSGYYSLYDLKWAIWSCLDNQEKPLINKEEGDYVIGLYHGEIKGCISDNGFILTEGIDIEEFNECDRVFLGDIHKKQTFRNEEIAYSGSTLQTKISEPPYGSIVIWEWDGSNYHHRFVSLKNIYSTITTDLENLDAVATDNENQLIVVKYDPLKITKTESIVLKKKMQSQYKNKIEFKPILKKKVKLNSSKENEEQKKINLQTILREYLEELKIDKKDIDKIIELDNEYTNNLDLTKDFEPGDFSIKMIEVENFLSYSPKKQIIDLEKEGIVGISGKNRVGKSSVFKAIIFCLYNTSPDNNASLKKLINKYNRSKNASVTLFLEKAGKYYKIKREIIPKKTDAVTTVLEFHEVDEFMNEIKSLTGEKRQETEKEIQKHFGLESVFEILSLYSAQKRQQELIDCKNAERLKLVNRFIGLQLYETKTEIVSDDLRMEKGKYQVILKEFNQGQDISQMKKNLISLKERELEVAEEIEELNSSDKIFEFKNRYLVYSYELNKTLSSKVVTSPEQCEESLFILTEKILDREKIIKRIEKEIFELNETKNKEATSFFKQYNGSIDKYKINWKEAEKEQNELAVCNAEIKRLEAQLLQDVCGTCNKEFTADDRYNVEKQIKSFKENAVELNQFIKEIDSKNMKIDKLQDEYSVIKEGIEALEKDLKNYKSEISTAKITIENLQLKSKDWDEVQKAKESLETLEQDYKKFISHKKETANNLSMFQNDLGAIKTQIKLLEKEIFHFEKYHQLLIETEEKIRLLKLYKDIVNKDGLPLYILKSKINEINEQVNLIVSQIFDFELLFSINDSSELNVEFFYEGDEEKNDVGFASGSETFIINLCIKVGLAQVSELPKLNSLLIDEGYGTLDADTLAKIPALFNVLPEYYKNIITISHLDELKDLYQHQIHLKKVDKFTEITN